MSQDIVADGLNMIKNARKARKTEVKINRISNLFVEILKIMKQKGAINRYKIDGDQKAVTVNIGNLKECNAIKPRFSATKEQLEKYKRRYLPSRNIGVLIVSTNKGLMTHEEAQKEKIGGAIIAYFY